MKTRIVPFSRKELRSLNASLDAAIRGETQIVLIEGEPGIGKTHLLTQLARSAVDRGAHTCWGRCWEGDGAPAFWPWIQILRAHASELEPDELDRLQKDIPGLLPTPVPRIEADPRCADSTVDSLSVNRRFILFDTIADLLRRSAERRPLLVVIDDLHWCDPSSLWCLQFAAQHVRGVPLLLAASFRSGEWETTPSCRKALESLPRAACRLSLGGLNRSELGALLLSVSGAPVEQKLIDQVVARSGGNPFFALEIARLWRSERAGDDDRSRIVPSGAADAIRRRLASLSQTTRSLLAAASVVGVEIHGRILAYVAPCRGRALSSSIDEALQSGMLEAVGLDSNHFRFAHALVRETLYADLPLAERTRLHQRTARALESSAVASPGSALAEIAFHYQMAGPRFAAKAIAANRRAGRHAQLLPAPESAVRFYEAALAASATRTDHPRRRGERIDILLQLGEALAQSGETNRSREVLLACVDEASAAGSSIALAQAALGLAGRGDVPTAADPVVIHWLERGLGSLPNGAGALRARILARLAIAVAPEDQQRALATSEQAIRAADVANDDAARSVALAARHVVLLGPDTLRERLAISRRLVALARRSAASERAVGAHLWRLINSLEAAIPREASVALRDYVGAAKELRQPFYLWQATALQATQALIEGRFDDAERLIYASRDLGKWAQSANAEVLFTSQLFMLRREQGRLDELRSDIDALASAFPQIPAFHCGRALLHSEAGRTTEARIALEHVAAAGFDSLPRDGYWLNGMTELAQACAFLSDRQRAQELYDRLRPYRGHNVVVGFASAFDGAVDRYLGLLAETIGRHADATRHFEDALAIHHRMGAQPFVAYTQFNYGTMLGRSNHAGDRRRARELLEAAQATARALGMAGLESRAAEAIAHTRASAGRTRPNDAHPDSAINAMHREGDAWTLAYRGSQLRVRHMRGLDYLAVLLSRPGTPVHVLDLSAHRRAGTEPPTHREPEMPVTHDCSARADPDARARTEFRVHLRDLRADLEEAKRNNDRGRAERVSATIAAIEHELASAYGIDGPRRDSGTATERCRKAVAKCLRSTIARIYDLHPGLGRHLDRHVCTGTLCVYEPDEPPVAWDVRCERRNPAARPVDEM